MSGLLLVAGGGLGGPGWLTGPRGLAGGLDPTGVGIQVSTGGLAAGVSREVARLVDGWVLSGTASLVEACGRALEATTAPSFGRAFSAELGVLERLGAELALLFLLLALIQAIVRQDLAGLARAVLLRLPAGLLLGAAAVGLVAAALQATDEMCSELLGVGGGSVAGLVGHVVTLLAGTGPTSVAYEGFAGLVVALAVGAVSLVLWLELVVRSAAIVVATLFLPLALAGLVWQASAHWARRLAEVLAALVLAKLVVVAVLVLAARTVAGATGLEGLVEGGALLLLATLSPFSLLRLVPLVEAGAIGHLESLGRRSTTRGLGSAVQLVETARARASERAEGLLGSGGVPLAEGTPGAFPSVVASSGALRAAGSADGPVDRGATR